MRAAAVTWRWPARIAAIGECMIEISRTARGGLREAYAGDTCNTAVYLARLLAGTRARVHYATALGTDRFSRAMLAAWRREGLRTDLVRTLAGRLPGLYYIDTDAHGERSFLYWRRGSAACAMLDGGHLAVLERQLSGYTLVYCSGISLAILAPAARRQLLALLARLRARGVRIAFDSNYRPRLWPAPRSARAAMRAAYACSDVALLSFDDEQALFGDRRPQATIARLARLGVGEIVVRIAGAGSLASAGGRTFTAAPAHRGRVLDTTAAGDAFNAAYLAARLRRADVAAALGAGHALASCVIRRRGAIIDRARTPALATLLGRV
ncbi:MAG: sugar kinase [Gammaproteobacteria bacterium]|nr:sugar kinase [Gammaproteobacteria bacterium]